MSQWLETLMYPTTMIVTGLQPFDVPVQVFGLNRRGLWTTIMRDPSYRGKDRDEVLRQLLEAVDKGCVDPDVTELYGNVHSKNEAGVGALKYWVEQGIMTLTPFEDNPEMLRVSLPIDKLREYLNGRNG